MNIWSLIYFTCFLFFVYSGISVLMVKRKTTVNRMFFLMCVTLSAWSFGYAFSTGAASSSTALNWRGISTFGWTYFYSTMVIFFVAITNNHLTRKWLKFSYLLYIPSTLFFFRFLYQDTGNFVESAFGWIYVLYSKTIWSYAFDIYYVFSALMCFFLLFIWYKHSDSKRERKQVKVIFTAMSVAFISGALTDTILPLFGLEILPMAIVFSTIVISGIWFAITKYQMMNLTQEIAAEHILTTMMDPVVIMNPHLIITQVNKSALTLTGYTTDTLIGSPVGRIIQDMNADHPLSQRILSEGSISGYEIELTAQSGIKTPCSCSGVYVKSEFGEKIGMILVLHDITNRKKSEALIENANRQLSLKVSKLRHVFDNVKEGILTFNQDLMVQDEYSLECERLFNKKIENLTFPKLIYPENETMEQFLNALLLRIFKSNKELCALYLPLLPEEITLYDKAIHIHYELTKNEAEEPIIMAILTDMTEKNALENQMDQERKILRMVIKTILHRADFVELYSSFKDFIASLKSSVFSCDESMLRAIHTYKGNFGQFDMLYIVDGLDALEEKLHNDSSYSLSESDQLGIENLLNMDMAIIESYVGYDYFTPEEQYTIKESHLSSLEHQLKQHLPAIEYKQVLPILQSLRYKTLHDLLKHYPEYTIKLGKRWGKQINPFQISGDLIYVDPKVYASLIKSLVHIFRNCVAHGIETEDERLEAGKTQQGNISCHIALKADTIEITVSDDGRGIDVDSIEKQILAKGLLDSTTLSGLSQREKLQLIIKENISTKLKADSLSGRGVGLGAVDAEVLACGGAFEVSSALNKGTTFTIRLPQNREETYYFTSLTPIDRFKRTFQPSSENSDLTTSGLL